VGETAERKLGDPMPAPPELPDHADVVIVGAGPAGLMAAIEAADPNHRRSVLVLERRPFAGGQVPVAGGGRCNVTNAGSVETLMLGFGRDGRWLEPALRRFDNVATILWFERRGVPMKEEKGGKMFPTSDDGADVQNTLIREAESRGARIALRARVEQVAVEEGRIVGIVANGKMVRTRSLVLSGGGSGPKPTPTSGVGLAATLGHAVVPPAPALAPIKLPGKPVESLAGVSLTARLSAGAAGFNTKKPRVSKVGEMLFTHFGLSGPVVLDLSHPLARLAAREPAELSLDVAPEIDDARAEVDRIGREEGARAVKNANFPGLPRRVFEHLIGIAGIAPDRRCAELRQPEREALARAIKDWRFPQFEVTWAGAMVSGGGVALTEVDPKTMASRRVVGLFFAGETLDLQGDCGGYNLQASFSTGALAGASAAAFADAAGRQ
jgi:predicted Rossmann fold flavoprotein